MAQIELNWLGAQRYLAIDSKGHTVLLSPPNDIGIKPSEGLLVALAACSAYDVVEITQKQRAKLQALKVFVTSEQAKEAPWRYQKIHLTYQITAEGTNQAKLERNVDLALNQYCSVRASLHPEIAVTFEVVLQSTPPVVE